MKQFSTLLLCLGLFSGLQAQNLPSYLPANGLVGWWPFNGNANDESGNGNHGTVNGATLTADRFGNVGMAYYLNGITDFIQTTYPGISSSGSRTVTFWANPEVVASNNYAFSYGGPFPGGIFAATVRCTPSDNIGTVISSAFINFFNPSVCGNWNFYCYSFPPGGQNQSNIKVYQNGLLLTNPTTQYNPTTIVNTANSSPLTFGKLVYVDGYPSNFKGRLDDFGFWNRELSQAEITQLYQAGNETSLSYQLSQQKLGDCNDSPVKLSVQTSVKVKTDSAGSIGSSSATAYGNILNDGGKTITRRGFCWDTSANPTLSNSFSENGSGNGTFSGSFSALNPSTTYYLRTYAGTATEVWYGNEISFTTATGLVSTGCGNQSSVTDIDGNVYPIVEIGTQCWMKENLKVSKYRNGDPIPTNLSDVAWASTTSGACAVYDNDASNNTTYGKLYNWYAVADPRALCPTGWHVPGDLEWYLLENYLDPSINDPNVEILRGSVIGGKLKAVSHLWLSGSLGSSNSSGFSALPGGGRLNNGPFSSIGALGAWWSGSNFSETMSWGRLVDSDTYISRYHWNNSTGLSVRCIKD